MANAAQLKITLSYVEPPIVRRVRVPVDVTLGNLHAIIQVAFGWHNCHMHQFVVGRAYYGMPDPELETKD